MFPQNQILKFICQSQNLTVFRNEVIISSQNKLRSLNRYSIKQLVSSFRARQVDCQQTHEKVLSITSHQINLNKTVMRYHHTPVRIAQVKNSRNNLCLQGCSIKGNLIHCCCKAEHEDIVKEQAEYRRLYKRSSICGVPRNIR